ncbi:MAG TPA: GNAT family N-acetyltransferase [Woeseiaceae bacterium]|nr:GNAT family N-acetyltransferase [Woeseiaceae bacterium]
MKVDIVSGIAEIDADAWNRLAGHAFPFLRHEFLHAAEHTGCVSAATGWSPRHIVISDRRGHLIAAMPLYEKSHSWGEFVFDWSWAEAYHRAGLEYYPKLVSAAPFTPAPSSRLLLKDTEDRESAMQLVAAAVDLAQESGCSSLHVLFPENRELGILRDAGMKLRKDCQFHWHNRHYRSFEEFLSTFSSAKRKKARRDRRRVREQGIEFRWLKGGEMDAAIWRDVYEMISMTFLRRGSLPYYDYAFFTTIARSLPDNVLVILAERNRLPIAAAVFYEGRGALYGRYWGSDSHFDALHFETCYYQGIDYCIANGIARFEPGTQGEHKISRGFAPVQTWSAHWLARPEFFAAVGEYLSEEQRHVDRYMEALSGHSPYRNDVDAELCRYNERDGGRDAAQQSK